jgi:hypothetical protein
MKRIIFLIGIFCLFQACIKDSGPKLISDYSNNSLEVAPIDSPELFCQSDTCQTYFSIWKDLFLSKNEMSQEYFDKHITLNSSLIHKWGDGISLEISFKVKIGWVDCRMQDKFIFYITNNYFPKLNVPRNALLSKDQIETVLNGNYYNSRINKISPVDELKYSSQADAIQALINASIVDTFFTSRVSFPLKSFDRYTVGHPYLIAGAALSLENNKCIEGSIDLINGETKYIEQQCVIMASVFQEVPK